MALAGKRTRLVMALFVALGLAAPASAAADDPVESAPPAQPWCSAYYGCGKFGYLAKESQRATVAVGSTEGFPTPNPEGGPPFDFEGTSGATGWWWIGGPRGTTLTIDTCGSSFSAQVSVYDTDIRYGGMWPVGYTADACADPLVVTYHPSDQYGTGPSYVRIDDATGVGGDYEVHYTRTRDTRPPWVGIRELGKGKLRPTGDGHRVAETEVSAAYRTHILNGPAPVTARCVLDDRRVKTCKTFFDSLVSYRHVKSGWHTLQITVTDADGNEDTAQRRFRVPYLKPKKKGK